MCQGPCCRLANSARQLPPDVQTSSPAAAHPRDGALNSSCSRAMSSGARSAGETAIPRMRSGGVTANVSNGCMVSTARTRGVCCDRQRNSPCRGSKRSSQGSVANSGARMRRRRRRPELSRLARARLVSKRLNALPVRSALNSAAPNCWAEGVLFTAEGVSRRSWHVESRCGLRMLPGAAATAQVLQGQKAGSGFGASRPRVSEWPAGIQCHRHYRFQAQSRDKRSMAWQSGLAPKSQISGAPWTAEAADRIGFGPTLLHKPGFAKGPRIATGSPLPVSLRDWQARFSCTYAGSVIISAGECTMPYQIPDPVDIPRLQQVLDALQAEIDEREQRDGGAGAPERRTVWRAATAAGRERELQPRPGELAPEDGAGPGAGHRLHRSPGVDRGDRQRGLAADRSVLAGGQAPPGQAAGGHRTRARGRLVGGPGRAPGGAGAAE